jgi:hypothetical protein
MEAFLPRSEVRAVGLPRWWLLPSADGRRRGTKTPLAAGWCAGGSGVHHEVLGRCGLVWPDGDELIMPVLLRHGMKLVVILVAAVCR